MKKGTRAALITAAVLFAVGLLLCAGALWKVNFNFGALSTNDEPVARSGLAMTDGLRGIRVEAHSDDVRVTRSADDQIHVVWYDGTYESYELVTVNGTLVLREKESDGDKSPAHWLQFDLREASGIELAVPEGFAGDLDLYTNAGGITCTDVSIGGEADLETQSGDASLRSMRAADIRLETSSGSIALDAVQSPELVLSAVSGDVSGTIDGAAADYTVSASSVSGDCGLSDRTGSGAGMLTVRTDSGSIDLRFLR